MFLEFLDDKQCVSVCFTISLCIYAALVRTKLSKEIELEKNLQDFYSMQIKRAN